MYCTGVVEHLYMGRALCKLIAHLKSGPIQLASSSAWPQQSIATPQTKLLVYMYI